MEEQNNFPADFNCSSDDSCTSGGGTKKSGRGKFGLGLFSGFLIAGVVVFIGFSAVIAFSGKASVKTEKIADPSAEDMVGLPEGLPDVEQVTNPAIRTFLKKKDASLCLEDGKPMIYLFSTSWCPHCQWIEETYLKFGKEVNESGKAKVYLFDVESGDNLLTSEKETVMPSVAENIYNEFSPDGGIPTFVFGCTYFRVGNGYETQDGGETLEEREFKTILEDILK
jgi:thiol-disulfide isomerase/thioredoxin